MGHEELHHWRSHHFRKAHEKAEPGIGREARADHSGVSQHGLARLLKKNSAEGLRTRVGEEFP